MYIIILLYGNSSGGVPATQYAHKPWESSHPHSFAGGLHLTWKFHRGRDEIIVDWPTVVIIYMCVCVGMSVGALFVPPHKHEEFAKRISLRKSTVRQSRSLITYYNTTLGCR